MKKITTVQSPETMVSLRGAIATKQSKKIASLHLASLRVARNDTRRRLLGTQRNVLSGAQIEEKSFEIISQRLNESRLGLKYGRPELEVAKRVAHATADFKAACGLLFHAQAVDAGIAAISQGANIIVDVNMVKAGINKKIARGFGCRVICLLYRKPVAQASLKTGMTKAAMAMRKARVFMQGAVVVIGNAPTALFEVCDLVLNRKIKPALIIGVPVGFVGAAEAKAELAGLPVPHITNRGRRGGSSTAAAITNALLILAKERRARG